MSITNNPQKTAISEDAQRRALEEQLKEGDNPVPIKDENGNVSVSGLAPADPKNPLTPNQGPIGDGALGGVGLTDIVEGSDALSTTAVLGVDASTTGTNSVVSGGATVDPVIYTGSDNAGSAAAINSLATEIVAHGNGTPTSQMSLENLMAEFLKIEIKNDAAEKATAAMLSAEMTKVTQEAIDAAQKAIEQAKKELEKAEAAKAKQDGFQIMDILIPLGSIARMAMDSAGKKVDAAKDKLDVAENTLRQLRASIIDVKKNERQEIEDLLNGVGVDAIDMITGNDPDRQVTDAEGDLVPVSSPGGQEALAIAVNDAVSAGHAELQTMQPPPDVATSVDLLTTHVATALENAGIPVDADFRAELEQVVYGSLFVGDMPAEGVNPAEYVEPIDDNPSSDVLNDSITTGFNQLVALQEGGAEVDVDMAVTVVGDEIIAALEQGNATAVANGRAPAEIDDDFRADLQELLRNELFSGGSEPDAVINTVLTNAGALLLDDAEQQTDTDQGINVQA